jgi:hypothetical protein
LADSHSDQFGFGAKPDRMPPKGDQRSDFLFSERRQRTTGGALRVRVETVLDCPADKAWLLVLPFARIVPDELPFPGEWSDKGTYFCRSYLFGFIPVGKRKIFFERVDSAKREIQSRESDSLIRRWDHLICIKQINKEQCLYSDEIEINAGPMTIWIWAWANWFYRHRQSRWKKLIRVK